MSAILKAFIENENAIKRFLKRFTSASQNVDDYAQEAFLKSFAAEVRGPIQEPKAFLFKVAKNVVLNDARTNSRSAIGHVTEGYDVSMIADEVQAAPEDWLDSRKKLISFAKAVACLSPQCRKAFLLRRMEGLQYKQIANRMDISVSAVEKHVTNGLLRCNRHLREHGYEPSEFGAELKVGNISPRSAINKWVKSDE